MVFNFRPRHSGQLANFRNLCAKQLFNFEHIDVLARKSGQQAMASLRAICEGNFTDTLLPFIGAVMAVLRDVQHCAQSASIFLPPLPPLNVAQQRLQEIAIIDQLTAEILALLEGVFAQESLTESVNCENGGLVEIVQGTLPDGAMLRHRVQPLL